MNHDMTANIIITKLANNILISSVGNIYRNFDSNEHIAFILG